MSDEPQDAPWLPLATAVFRLQYEIPCNRGTRRGFLSECLADRREIDGSAIYDPGLADKKGAPLTAAHVDFDTRHFVYTWTRPGGFPITLRARPWELGGGNIPSELAEGVWARLAHLGGEVWRQLVADFSQQVEAGEVVVEGRPNSSFAAFREVPADQWRGDRVQDWEYGVGSTDHGELLTGLRARLRRSNAEAKARSGRRPKEGDWVRAAIASLHPDGLPDRATPSELHSVVDRWIVAAGFAERDEGKEVVSVDTVARVMKQARSTAE